MDAGALMKTYARLDISFEKGEGVWLYDQDNRRYLDAISGIGVNALGHAYPSVTKAIAEQAGKLLHTSNLYHIEKQALLAKKLCEVSGMDRVFFSNSGAEANEAAIKLARLHGFHQNIEAPSIITFSGAFHGRTLATLTATGNEKIKKGFAPDVPGFLQATFNDLDSVRALADNPSIVGVLIEPVQGEGGVNPADPAFLSALQALCNEKNWLFMLDEVQTGNGRTGHYFCYQSHGLQPDVVTTAKGLGNGVPIGACLAKGKAAGLFQPGHHGSTYGGNPLACASALATTKALTEEGVMENAKAQGDYLLSSLRQAFGNHPDVQQIRGCGLMLGIELKAPNPDLLSGAMELGILINVTAGKVIRLLPPLIITREEADTLIDNLKALLG